MIVIGRGCAIAVLLILLVGCEGTDVGAPTADDHVRGPSDAKVTLVEYGDYQCPPCSNSAVAIERLLATYPRDLRFIYRHFPTKRHRNAVAAATAAEAAEQQGKFWEMHAMLFSKQQLWYGAGAPNELFIGYAQELGLDVARFRAALESEQLARRIQDSRDSARKMGVRGAPAFFLNGTRLTPTPLRYDDLQRHVAKALATQ